MRLSDFFKKQPSGPQYILDYLQLDFAIPARLPVDDAYFLVLDCETTGLEKNDKLITLGAIPLAAGMMRVDDFLDQRYPMTENTSAAEIHGELSSGQKHDVKNLIRQFLALVSNKVIVGHYIAFDISKINQVVKEFFPGFSLKNKVLDTCCLMRRLDPVKAERQVASHTAYSLEALCEEFGVPVENRHTALGDAYLTAQVFLHIAARLKQRGITTLRDLLKRNY